MSEKLKKEWIIGAEYCAYEIFGTIIAGFKFIRLVDEDKNTITGKFFDNQSYHTIKFSKHTGKQFRPNYYKKYWLTLRKVERK